MLPKNICFLRPQSFIYTHHILSLFLQISLSKILQQKKLIGLNENQDVEITVVIETASLVCNHGRECVSASLVLRRTTSSHYCPIRHCGRRRRHLHSYRTYIRVPVPVTWPSTSCESDQSARSAAVVAPLEHDSHCALNFRRHNNTVATRGHKSPRWRRNLWDLLRMLPEARGAHAPRESNPRRGQ